MEEEKHLHSAIKSLQERIKFVWACVGTAKSTIVWHVHRMESHLKLYNLAQGTACMATCQASRSGDTRPTPLMDNAAVKPAQTVAKSCAEAMHPELQPLCSEAQLSLEHGGSNPRAR